VGVTSPGRRTVLVADDDPRLRHLVTWALEMGNYNVVAAADGPSALDYARQLKPDLYILDVSMPGMDGFEVCRRLREEHVISPILMLTGRNEEADKIAGLEVGADDYQTKPFGSRELLARVNALLRRAQIYEREPGQDVFTTGALTIDFDQHLAYKSGQQLDLTPTEFNVLALLARTPGDIVSSQTILAKVWGPAYRDEIHLLRVNIARLRRKIEDNPKDPRYVLTHPRAGYSLAVM
jgi:DNA-binding response OmpR family regulator